jgi:hypothetical protein
MGGYGVGADVRLRSLETYMEAIIEAGLDKKSKAASLDECIAEAAEQAIRLLQMRARVLRDTTKDHQATGSSQVAVLNMSWNYDPFRQAGVLHALADAKPGSALANDIQKLRSSGSNAGEDKLAQMIHDHVYVTCKADYDAARAELTQAAIDARQAGIFAICGMGNSGMEGMTDADVQLRTAYDNGVEGIHYVGASDVRGVGDATDDTMTEFSSPGIANSAAPGAGILLGPWASEIRGTSFAGPMLAGAVLLAIANNPKLTCDQVKECLEETAVDIEGTTLDGKGVMNVVSFIEKACPVPAEAPAAEAPALAA